MLGAGGQNLQRSSGNSGNIANGLICSNRLSYVYHFAVPNSWNERVSVFDSWSWLDDESFA
jgi:hypothetical protein